MQTRNRIAAIDAATGEATSWNPNANGAVYALAVSGTTVYAGGMFNAIGGQTRNNIAAIDATTGAATSWNPNANGIVYALAVSGTTVYAGGWFTSIGGQTRNYIAAIDATTGAATSWNPNANGWVYALAVSGTTVYAGGMFNAIGGQTRNYIAALDASGNATSWNPNADSYVLALAVSGTTVYAGGYFTTIGGVSRPYFAQFDCPSPTVTGITPDHGVNNGSVSITNLAGTEFRGPTVKLTKSGQTAIDASSVVVVLRTKITCTFNLNGKAVGYWNVVVTNDDGKSGTLPNGFEIHNPVPTTTSIDPTSKTAGDPEFTLTVNGTNFVNGSTVQWNGSSRTTAYVDSTQLTATITATDIQTAGEASVTVFNSTPGGGTSNAQTFTIEYPAPTVTSITPNHGNDNEFVVDITDLAGTGFRTGATVRLRKSGQSDITATDVAVVSPIKITCKFDLSGKAEGKWNVWVTNDDGKSGILTEGFTIESTAPSVYSITPSSADNTGMVDITDLSGANFSPTAVARLDIDGQPSISAADLSVLSSTKITCKFDLTGRAVGRWDVVVENENGKTGRLDKGFNVGNTKAGELIGVHLDESTVLFQNVTLAGNTSKEKGSAEPVGDYHALADTCVEIHTTAEFTGNVRLTMQYSGDLTQEEKESTVILQKIDGVWLDKTVSRDIENSTVTALTSSLTKFVVAYHEARPASTWYFAEGCTRDNYNYQGEKFDTWFMLQNVSDKPADVRATFMTYRGEVIEKDQVVSPHSRYTLHADEIPGLEDTQMSTRFVSTNGVPIVAERAMYFSYYGLREGSASIGVNEPSDTYYLAEGYVVNGGPQGDRFDTYVLVQNPNNEAAQIVAEFMGDGWQVDKNYTVGAHSRFTIIAGQVEGLAEKSFSTKITSVNGVKIVAERAMYFMYRGKKGGSASVGSPYAASKWYLPEGYTGGSFDTYILIQNPGTSSADVKLTFMKPDGGDVKAAVSIPPRSRKTVFVDEIAGLSSTEVSTVVESATGSGIVVERSMYFDFNGRIGGHCSIGAPATSHWITGRAKGKPDTWCMAEGETGDNFDTFILLMNPTDTTADVRVEYMLPQGESIVQTLQLGPASRYTIHVDKLKGLFDTPVSTRVDSTNGVPIVSERSSYFLYGGDIDGGTDSIGYHL